MNHLTYDDFADMRRANPKASPALLFDMGCERLGSSVRWATAGWQTCSNWMDLFATVNPYTSCRVH